MRRTLVVFLAVAGLAGGALHLSDGPRFASAPPEAQASIFVLTAVLYEKRIEDPTMQWLTARHATIHRAFIATGVIIAALLALVLCLKHLPGAGAYLRDSLALGSGSLGFLIALYPWLALEGILPRWLNLGLACIALAGSMISLWLFGLFAANYPQTVQDSYLPERNLEWYWGRVFRQARERGVSRMRAVVDEFKRGTDPTVFGKFLKTGRAQDSPGSGLLDRKLHRMIQGRGFVIALVTLIILSMLAADRGSGGLLTLASISLVVLWLFVPAFIYIPACMHYWEIGYARGDEAERRTIRWMLASIYLAVIIYLVSSVLLLLAPMVTLGIGNVYEETVLPLFMALLMWLLPGAWFMLLLAIAASIFLRGAVEPTLVLKRSILYGIIVVSMTAVFVTVENLLQSQAIERLGLPEQAAVIITGTIVALLLGPLRNRIEQRITSVIDRLLPPEP